MTSRIAPLGTRGSRKDSSVSVPAVIPKPDVQYSDYTDIDRQMRVRMDVAKKVRELLKGAK